MELTMVKRHVELTFFGTNRDGGGRLMTGRAGGGGPDLVDATGGAGRPSTAFRGGSASASSFGRFGVPAGGGAMVRFLVSPLGAAPGITRGAAAVTTCESGALWVPTPGP